MGLVRVETELPPVVDPDEVKAQLGITDNSDDGLLAVLIGAVTRHLDGKDGILGRALATQTWDWTFDRWPCGSMQATWRGGAYGVLTVPLPPLQEVTSITYIDSAGETQIWDPANYQVDTASEPGRIGLAYNASFPSLRGGDFNAVTVRFVAGYGAPEDVPDSIRQAVIQTAAHMYRNRAASVVSESVPGVASFTYGTTSSGGAVQMPEIAEMLLAPYRVYSF